MSLCWHGGSAERGHGAGFLNNHNWVEVFLNGDWAFVNVPPTDKAPNAGLCAGTFTKERGCDYDPTAPKGEECAAIAGGPGAAMQDHEIYAVSWALPDEHGVDGGPIVAVANWTLSDGEKVSPLVWSPNLKSPLGIDVMDVRRPPPSSLPGPAVGIERERERRERERERCEL